MAQVSIEIDDVASVGCIRDVPPHLLPPEAWTLADNMRFNDVSVARMSGYMQIFGTPSVPPYYAMFISTLSQPWWIYTSLTKAYVYDGSTHTNITRQTAGVDVNYGANGASDWNGTILGGIPIINNGVDTPQYWSSYSTGTKLADLPNWTATMRARVIRAFGPYLMAFNITLGGVSKPHDVRWSQPADPGTVPSSWDISNPATDAGEVSLPDVDSGVILDALPLQGRMYVYKENSIWRFRNVGGRFIFDEDAIFETIGLLATRCVAITGEGQRHFFVSNDNVWVHDGNKATPFLEKKFKRYLFNQIDVANYGSSFVFVNSLRNEGWFCYPSQGNSVPNRALVVNYNTGALTEGDIDFQCAVLGTIQTGSGTTWAGAAGAWSAYTSPWSVSNRRKIAILRPTQTKIYQFDLGGTKDGVDFTGTLQRTSLGVIGRKRTGEWIEDFEVRKLVTRIWPKISSGGPVEFRLGGQDIPNGSIRWSPSAFFDPNTQKYVDIIAEGAAISLEIKSNIDWQLDGYKLDMSTLGRF